MTRCWCWPARKVRRALARLALLGLVLGGSGAPDAADAGAGPAALPPAGDTWLPISTTSAPGPRAGHSAVWTGAELLVWGGSNPAPGADCARGAWRPTENAATAPSSSGPICGEGGRYDPVADAWRPIPLTTPRSGHTAVWTGSEMLVFGGRRTIETVPGGAAYSPATNTWRALSDMGAPSQRDQHTAVWTGRELLVWGGCCGVGATGGRYDPARDTWSPVATAGAPSPRGFATAVWTGAEMLVWGGLGAAPAGSVLPTLGDGAAYNPATDTWRPVPSAAAPSPRAEHPAVWTGRELLVWGGRGPGGTVLGDGAAYTPATNTWRPLPEAGAPSPRGGHTAVWTGRELLVWGGSGPGETLLNDGGRYFPPGFAPPAPRDARYVVETGFRIDHDPFWGYFTARGGIDTFGFPVSRTFLFLGCTTQVFQRQLLQQCGSDAPVRTMNLLDPALLPYNQINFSVFPAHDPNVAAGAPSPETPNYGVAVLNYVRSVAPETFEGLPVHFFRTFVTTVPGSNPAVDPDLAALVNLELWGFPTSQPAVDPANHTFVYQRFQRGILHYDHATGVTRGILLADWFKSLLTGEGLPPDLAQQAQGSRFLRQYCPDRPQWVCRPSELPGTDLAFAFERQ